jgi:hypothetical protein
MRTGQLEDLQSDIGTRSMKGMSGAGKFTLSEFGKEGTNMKEVEVVKMIKTKLLRRGEGKMKSDPIRIIEQYWDFEGNLLFEIDPANT